MGAVLTVGTATTEAGAAVGAGPMRPTAAAEGGGTPDGGNTIRGVTGGAVGAAGVVKRGVVAGAAGTADGVGMT